MVYWQYWKGRSWESKFISEEYDTLRTLTFEECDELRITTIEPPILNG